jgi:uncharacterized protein (TIGR02246 family)
MCWHIYCSFIAPMRNLIVCFALFFILIIPATSLSKPDNPAGEKEALKECVENLADAWNNDDTDALDRLFSQDSVLVPPTGSAVRTREGIKKRLIKERQGRLAGTNLTNSVDRITIVDPNTAVVRGKYHLDGMSLLLGLKTSAQGSFVLRQKKQDGKWMISKAQINKS